MNNAIISEMLQKVRNTKPLIHNITNVVVTNFTANGLLALGASPVMAYAKEEVADMAKIAGALVLNIGTLNNIEVQAMLLAGESANRHNVPVIFDPVGAGATAYRTETALSIMNQVKVAVLRGNAAEIANVAGRGWDIKGVDAGEAQGSVIELAISSARKWSCVVIITGKEDVVSDGETTYVVRNGHPMLTNVTGAGCLLTSVVGAFAAVENEPVKAAVSAVCTYGVAAEIAAMRAEGRGPGTFQFEFLNQLSLISADDIGELGRFDKI